MKGFGCVGGPLREVIPRLGAVHMTAGVPHQTDSLAGAARSECASRMRVPLRAGLGREVIGWDRGMGRGDVVGRGRRAS